MNEQDKQLLLKALCAMLPYGCKVKFKNIIQPQKLHWSYISDEKDWDLPMPYLRPMSSMTEEERKKLREILCWDFAPEDCPIFEHDFSVTTFYSYNEREENKYYDMKTMLSYFEFLNSHHFDYHGLIEKGLALEAPEGMYNFKNN